MTSVKFEKAGTVYLVRFPYNRHLVETLKSSVPSWGRQWKPDTKQWVIDGLYARGLAADLRTVGCTVIGLTAEPPPRTAPAADDPSKWAHLLFRRVGTDRRQAIYRALSKCLHPDVGGDAAMQREMNDAFKQAEGR